MLRILFRIIADPGRAAAREDMVERATLACTETLQHFVRDVPRESRDAWVPLVTLVLRELLALPDDQVSL
jgi:brefeldin A-inhibited guanine nucleotide-exchange protein